MSRYTIADVFETLLRIQLVRGDLMAPRNGQSVKPGERTNPEGKPVSNILLLSIPDSEYQLVRPHLEFVELRYRATLHEPNQQIGFVYFPNGGVVSMVFAMADVTTVEAGVLGVSGLLGLPCPLPYNRTPP